MIDWISSTLGSYEWQLSLYAAVAVFILPVIAKHLFALVPALKHTQQLNKDRAAEQVKKSFYMPIQNRSMAWGFFNILLMVVFVFPFCITGEPQPWWNIVLDCVVILMFYDFFYYLTHRFLFHDGGFGPGPLMSVHAVHHQNKNPCRKDSNYLHPLETCIGLSLYGLSVAFLAFLMGDFHVITLFVTWTVFSAINTHNHDLMEADHFPFKYLHYMSFMHHVHHNRFTSGNFATITLFYDWLFGTYDTGQGWGKNRLEKNELQEQ